MLYQRNTLASLAGSSEPVDYLPITGPCEILPHASPLAMPRQNLNADPHEMHLEGFEPIRPAAPATSPLRMTERRVIFFGATLLTAAAAAATPFLLYARDGFNPLEVVGLALFSLLVLAISCWFCNAVAGLAVLIHARAPALSLRAATPAPAGRTALLMPIYNEDAAAAVGRLAATEVSLTRLGANRNVDLFVLSDSTREEVAADEWATVTALAEIASCPVYYRRRHINHERKVGNISEWVRRFGGAYDYMVVLDADSTMAGETILHLVDAMERNPGVGLIQTAPTIVGAETLFARASQFGVKLYGRVAAAGLAWWTGSEGTYWGHNAIIRVRAFAECAGLPTLPGRKPFGGHVMSHDVLEASLLRRGGWAVHVTPALGGSTEETPPGLRDFMVRERRWCQGNLQHLALLRTPGLHWINRLQLVMGAMAYLASPLWFCSLMIGLAVELQNPVDWGSFLYILHPQLTPLLWASMMTTAMLMGPKIIGLVLVLSRAEERKAFGGTWTLLKGAATEAFLSMITAPVLMASNTRVVVEVLMARDAGWSTQSRIAGHKRVSEAVREHRWELGVGIALLIALAFRPDLALWFSPILLPLLLAGPLAALISRSDIGAAAKRLGLMLTPEEIAAGAGSRSRRSYAPAPVVRLVVGGAPQQG